MSEVPFKLIKISKESYDRLDPKRKNTMYIVEVDGKQTLYFEDNLLTYNDTTGGGLVFTKMEFIPGAPNASHQLETPFSPSQEAKSGLIFNFSEMRLSFETSLISKELELLVRNTNKVKLFFKYPKRGRKNSSKMFSIPDYNQSLNNNDLFLSDSLNKLMIPIVADDLKKVGDDKYIIKKEVVLSNVFKKSTSVFEKRRETSIIGDSIDVKYIFPIEWLTDENNPLVFINSIFLEGDLGGRIALYANRASRRRIVTKKEGYFGLANRSSEDEEESKNGVGALLYNTKEIARHAAFFKYESVQDKIELFNRLFLNYKRKMEGVHGEGESFLSQSRSDVSLDKRRRTLSTVPSIIYIDDDNTKFKVFCEGNKRINTVVTLFKTNNGFITNNQMNENLANALANVDKTLIPLLDTYMITFKSTISDYKK